MNAKLLMRTKKLAKFMLLPTLMVITGLSLAKQELSSVRLTEGSVFSNLQQDGGLYMAQQAPAGDICRPPGGSCDRNLSKI